MERKEKMRHTLVSRKNMYLFLSRLYILEADAELIKSLKEMEFPADTGISELDEGYEGMENFRKEIESVDLFEKLEELAVDYADVFLAAGVAQGLAAFPYESVYTSRKKLMMQEARDQVHAFYSEKQLALSEGFAKMPEDHIAVEMEFMAHLCEEAIAAIDAEDEKKLISILEIQKQFFKEHIQGWIPVFCQNVDKYAKTLFYQSVSKITRGFLRWEGNNGILY